MQGGSVTQIGRRFGLADRVAVPLLIKYFRSGKWEQGVSTAWGVSKYRGIGRAWPVGKEGLVERLRGQRSVCDGVPVRFSVHVCTSMCKAENM